MKIFVSIEKKASNYVLTLPALPAFSLSAPSINEALTRLPDSLKAFILNWERQNQEADDTYLEVFPYIQRIKARSFYQSTVHRLQEVYALRPLEQLDLEFIHRLQRKEYEEFLTSNT